MVIPVAKTSASGAVPVGPKMSDGTTDFKSLQGAGFLPSGFVDGNSNNQFHVVLVREPNLADNVTPSGNLDALVSTYGGSAFSDSELASISSSLGAGGGGVYTSSASNTQITGTYGGWAYATALWDASLAGTSVKPSSGHPTVSLTFVDENQVISNVTGTSLGVGQKWANVKASRVINTSYQNTTGNPIVVNITAAGGSVGGGIVMAQVSEDNLNWIDVAWRSDAAVYPISFIVPNNSYYKVKNVTSIQAWAELR